MTKGPFAVWFCGLVAAHLTLFCVLPFGFASFEARASLFSINALPWYPLHYFGLPVTRHGLLTLPNAIGWIWCFAVWVLFYLALALLLARWTSHGGAAGGVRRVKQGGRSGELRYYAGERYAAAYYELSGVPQFDLLVSLDAMRNWSDGQSITQAERAEIRSAFEAWALRQGKSLEW